MTRLPLSIFCPKGCHGHAFSSYVPLTMSPIFGKLKNPDTSDILTIKCPQCKFEAWASKDLRDKYGKPKQSYYDSETQSIKSDTKRITK